MMLFLASQGLAMTQPALITLYFIPRTFRCQPKILPSFPCPTKNPGDQALMRWGAWRSGWQDTSCSGPAIPSLCVAFILLQHNPCSNFFRDGPSLTNSTRHVGFRLLSDEILKLVFQTSLRDVSHCIRPTPAVPSSWRHYLVGVGGVAVVVSTALYTPMTREVYGVRHGSTVGHLYTFL